MEETEWKLKIHAEVKLLMYGAGIKTRTRSNFLQMAWFLLYLRL